jgi:hypothetical protein
LRYKIDLKIHIICGAIGFTNSNVYFLEIFMSFCDHHILCSSFLQSREEFTNLLYLSTVDVISVKLWFDKKVSTPYTSSSKDTVHDMLMIQFCDM